MNKSRDPMTQRILDLTLEIIYLLTGEDHIVVKNPGGRVARGSSRQVSKGFCRTHSPNTMSSSPSLVRERHNEQKILELTHRILRLLTGEVPIRCEDVTVHLSMEEWEYVERHKDLYKDVMMEDHQPVITADKSVSGGFHAPVSLRDIGMRNGAIHLAMIGGNHQKRKAWKRAAKSSTHMSLSRKEGHLRKRNIHTPRARTHTEDPSTNVKESTSCEEGNVAGTDLCTLTEHTQTEYIKEELASQEGDLTDPETEYPSVCIKEEPVLCRERTLTDTDMYSTCVKEELAPCEDLTGLYTRTEYPPVYVEEYLMEDINPLVINPRDSLIGSRNPDRNVYTVTEHIPYDPVYRGNSECRENFNYRLDHFKIQNVHTGRQPFSCSQCGKCFAERSILNKHRRSHSGEKPFKCGVCGKCFALNCDLARHQRIHSGDKPFKCAECGKCFTLNCDLVRHQRIHTGDKPFKCTVCGKCFTQASHLASHKLIHTGKKPFKCSDCEETFTWASQLASHKWVHVGEKPFKCPECGKYFSLKTRLNKHMKTHAGDKPFSCGECGKCFTQAAHLASHKIIHTGEKPFDCPDCGKCFSRKGSFVRHQKIHRREKSFECAECGECFTWPTQLASHKWVHSGEKPFCCPDCGKCFNRKCSFIRHQKIHKGEKSFKCSECEECFTWATQLASHKWIHSGEKPFKCNECGKYFLLKTRLNRHLKTHAREKTLDCPDWERF